MRQAKLARPEQLALKVPLALMARRVRKVTSDLWVYKAPRESKAKPVQQAQLAPLALTAHKVCRVPLALTAHKAYKVTSDQLDRKVFREFKAKPAQLAQQAQLVLRVM